MGKDIPLRPGKAGPAVLDRSVMKLIRGASVQDGAFFISTDPVTMRTEHAGKLAVHAVCNDMYAAGLVPKQCTLTVLLPEGSMESSLRRIMAEAAETAAGEKVEIAGGHTEVTGAVTRPVVCASAAGLPAACGTAGRAKPLRDGELQIIMTGFAAAEGSFLMASECGEVLGKHFPEDLIRKAAERFAGMLSVREAALAIFHAASASGMEELYAEALSEGGVFAGLWKLCDRLRCGMRVRMEDIPILQETVEMSNVLPADPYSALSGGSLLVAADAAAAEEILQELAAAGVPAAVIGKLVPGKDRLILNDDEERYLDRPGADALYPFLGIG